MYKVKFTPYRKGLGKFMLRQTKHKNLILDPAILPWFVGFKKSKDKGLYLLVNL